jgi:gliding motility-associated-like protein
MIVQIKRITLLSCIFWLSVHEVFSQSHVSKNNYTGDWATATSWSPTWPVPQTNISGYNITINGYITVNGSLSFSGAPTNLIINDTLVLKGDLFLDDYNDLTINDNGILIVRGNLFMHNHSEIIANGYLIITGYIDKHGPNHEGSLTSNDNPVKVFVGGTIFPEDLTHNEPNYPALNCTAPITTRYPHSNCSYGNMTDIINDPIYPFFLSTCTIAPPTITAGGPTTFCTGGSVTLTSSAGTSYLWSNGATTRSINITTSGSYTVKVTNASGCLSAASAATIVTVNALPATPTITAGGPTTFCAGGSVTLTSGPEATYLWSNGATTQSINVTTAGSYSVRVRNANGCQSATSVATIVTVNALPATPTITASGPTTFCAGGSVILTSSAGSTYLWSTGATTPNINVTIGGIYTVRVTNANGCQSAASVARVVTVNALPATPTITVGGPTIFCAGGSVTLTSSAGTSYLWSNGAITQSINITISGSYTVKVTNASGCQSASSAAAVVSVNALPITPTITTGGPTTFCAGGSVTLTSSSGTGYLWSNGATTASINVSTAGSYTVKVTNASGCQSAASVATIVTVNALPAIPTITAGGPVTFCSGGNVTLTSSAGTSYLWSNGATTQSINITTPGSFTVRVTNASGCQSAPSAVTAVNVNALPIVDAGADATISNGTSTTINATVTGTGPFTYSWSPPSQLVNPFIEDPSTVILASTTVFTLTATSLTTTCSNTDAVAITITGGSLNSVPTATPLTICAGANIQLHALASGGSGSYTYTWTSTPAGFTSSIADPISNPLVTTTYRVVVNDGFTTVNPQVTVTVNSLPPTPTIAAGGPTTFCAGGSVTLTSSAGTSYLWSNGATTQSINVTAAGNYTVQVTNASGCLSAVSAPVAVIVNAVPVTPNITPAGPTTFCAGGSVTLTSSAGTGYLWSNGATTQSINVTVSGSYSVKVISVSGCQSASSVATVVTVNALPGIPGITADGSTTFCAGGNVTLSSSPEAGYLWSNGATAQSINITTPGNYTVQVINASGCQSSASAATSVTVNALPVTPTITAGGPTTFCDGGSVTLTSSAGTSYLWSNGATTASINITASGNYTVQVTNASGCQSALSAAANVTVNSIPPTPTISAIGPTTFCDGGSVTLTSNAATSYLWSNAATSASINVTTAGSYAVMIYNASGCQSASSVPTIVTVNALPATPTITADGPTTFCIGESVILTSSEGTSYLWSSGATLPGIIVSTAGIYTVKVTNASGCLSAASGSVSIAVNTLPVVTTGYNGPVCAGSALSLSGGPAGMRVYYWSGPGEFSSLLQNPSVSDSATLDMAGIYTLIVANNNGCSDTSSTTIIVSESPIAVAGPEQELKFTFETQMNSELSASETGEWSIISGSGHISDIHSPTARVTELSIGENKFLWKVMNGICEDTATVKITVHDLFVPSVITPNGDGKNDYFKISEFTGNLELIIFNRWGNEEYTNANYLNDWDGRNKKGSELPEDTYFYILKFENGTIKKGSVLIKR